MASQRTLELVLKIANQASSELQKVKSEFQGLSLNFGFDSNGFKAIIDQINQLKEAFGDTKSARDNAKLAQDVARAQAEQLKVEQQAEKLAQDKLKTQQQEISLQQQIAKQEEEIARKAEAAAKAEAAKTQAYGQQAQAIAALAQSLGITYSEAEKLNKSLGLSSDKIKQAFDQISQFDKVKLSKDEQFKALQSSLGITKEQFKQINEEFNKFGEGDRPAKVAEGLGEIAFKFNNVVQAVQTLASAAKPAYDFLIASNEKLNAQILSSQTNLASATRVFQGGQEITDASAKIDALRGDIEKAISQVEKDSEQLSGITSETANQFFQATLVNTNTLIGQSKQYNNAIESATALTKGWASAFSLLKIPADQVNSEIRAILSGTELENSQIAQSIGLNKQQIDQYKAQGILVDKLVEKLSVFTAGNAKASRSIEGVGSNITEIFQRLGREAGKPFLQPIIDGLTKLEGFLKENSDQIVNFFATFTTGIANTGKDISEKFGSTFQAIFKIVQEGAPLVSNLFTIIQDGATTAATVLNPLLTFLGEVVAKALEGYKAISELILLRQINDQVDALNNLQRATDAVSQEAINAASRFKELQAIQANGGKLTADQQKEYDGLKKQIADLLPAIDQQIAAYKALPAATPEIRAQNEANVKSLEQLKRSLQGSTGEIQILAPEVEKLGNSYQQLEKKASNASRVLQDANAKAPQIQQAAKDLIEATKAQLESGSIDEKQAEERLKRVADDSRVEVSIQQNAQKAITDARKDALQDQIADIDGQLAEVQAKAESGTISEVQSAQETTRLKREQLKLQLEDLKTAIAAEQEAISKGRGSKERLEDLQRQQRKVNADLQKEVVEGAKRVQDERLKVIERAEKKATAIAQQAETERSIQIQQLINKGLLTKEEADQRRLQSTRQTIEAELKAEKASLAALSKLPKQSNPEAEEKRQESIRSSRLRSSQLVLKLLENEKQQQQALTAIIQKRIDREFQGIKNNLEASKQSLETQLRLQEGLSKALEQQQQILSARQDLQRSLNDLAQGQYANAIRLLESQFSEEDRLEQAQKRRLELQKKINEAKTPEEKSQAEEELAALDKQEARETQLRNLRIEAKQAEIAAAEQEFKLQQQSLELEQQKTLLLQEQEKTRLSIQAIEAKAGTAQAVADRQKTLADRESTPEQRKAAELAVQAAVAREQGVQQQQQLQERSGQFQQDLFNADRQKLAAQQGLKLSGLQADLAALTPGAQDDRALFQQDLTTARNTQKDLLTGQSDRALAAVQQDLKNLSLAPGLVPQIDRYLGQNSIVTQELTGIKSLLGEINKALGNSGTLRDFSVNQQISGQIDPKAAGDAAARQVMNAITTAFNQVGR